MRVVATIMKGNIYFSLHAKRFGAIASTWLLGNVMQNFLQSLRAFDVNCEMTWRTAVMKKMLETSFLGIDDMLANHSPSLRKRLLGKLVLGVNATIMVVNIFFLGCDYVAPPLGISLCMLRDLEPLQALGFLAMSCKTSCRVLGLSMSTAT